MFLIRLYLFIFVNLFLYGKCSIPSEKFCVNQKCDEPISLARSNTLYNAPESGVLSFSRGQKMVIISKGKKKDEYWEAIIDEKKGYVPSNLITEFKIYQKNLIPVTVQQSEAVLSNSNHINNSNAVKKQIKPTEAEITVIEGTTIYADKSHEINPSVTVEMKSTYTASAINANLNQKPAQHQERATIPPEVINFNSDFRGQNLTSNFKIETVEKDDDNAKIESRGIDRYIDKDEEDEDEDDDDDDEDEKDAEGLEDDEENDEINNVSATPQPTTAQTTAEATPQNVVQNVTSASSATPPKGVEKTGEPALQNVGQKMPEAVTATPQPITVGTTPLKVQQLEAHEAGFVSKQSASQNLGENTAETHPTTPQAVAEEIEKVKQQSTGQQKKAESRVTSELNNVSATPQPPTAQTTAEATSQNVVQNVTSASAATPPNGTTQTITVGTNSETTPSEVEQMVPQEAGFVPKPEPVLKNLGKMDAAATAQSDFVPGATATHAASQSSYTTGPNTASQNLATESYPKTSEAGVGITGEENLNNMEQKKAEATTFTPQSSISTGPNAASENFEQKLTQTNTRTPHGGARINAEAPLQNAGQAGIESPAELTSARAALETPLLSVKEKVTEDLSAPQQAPLSAGSQISDSIMPGAKSEEIHKAMPSLAFEKTSTTFGEFSALTDSSPKDVENIQKPSRSPETIGEKSEMTTEAHATTFQPGSKEIGSEFSQTTNKGSLTPDTIPEKVETATEALNTRSVPDEVTSEDSSPEDGPKETEKSQIPENNAEEPGMLSQITGMFSSWFASPPGEVLTDDKVSREAFQDLRADGKAEVQTESSKEAPLGTCPNSELGFDCKDFSAAEEQRSFWSDWIPAGSGFENVLTQSNTVVYLIVTAVTVLLFTLGHNFIEKRGKTGPLIAKINKLEHELLVTSKECALLKDEIHAAREKIILYENSANDELVISLQAELEESKKAKAELESSIEVLQQELDAATEAGLDLNKMLSEVLTQKGGSETLLKSVENLQAQLDSQQKVIDEMTKKLGVKNQENEALQLALQSANDKSENLEEQLTDIKHNLNLHLKEKEDVTRDLNARINQLVSCTNQLWETKEEETSKFKAQLEELQKKLEETSSALTVKEEEVKALKQSMKHLKGKGDVKLETVFDFSRIKAELAKEAKEKQVLLEKLGKEESSGKALSEKVNELESEMQKMKKNFEEAEQKKEEAEKKLEVLSTYFKEKETQLQKELGLQEALWAQKKGDENAVCNMMKSLQEEVESYKSQNETLKKEILDQERGLKNQIAGLEQKAHENWVAARQAERKLEEAKQEMSQLRNRLVSVMEKNSNNVDGKGNIRSTEELNGVEAASPILHETSSPLLFPPLPLDPNSSNLLPPGFMPPPMFMPPPIGGFMPPPPFLPGDRRPPPLGRMSSPPLNNRFSPSSPADYPFERMSSPPLSPPGSNYRSLNDDRDHYRHRTPPYPPPLHPRNWDDGSEIPGFIPISSQRDSRRDHKGSNVSSEHSSSESLDKSSRHSGRV